MLSTKQLSAFIPFCAYSTNLMISGSELWLPNISFPLCSSFRPTILEGQLCYKLRVDRMSGKGKTNELMLLLDYQEDLKIFPKFEEENNNHTKKRTTISLDTIEKMQREEAKIQIGTLSYDKGFGEGTYKMSVVKKMTAKSAFLEMPMKFRKCQVEPFEECRTKALIDRCRCVPWELLPLQVSYKHQV